MLCGITLLPWIVFFAWPLMSLPEGLKQVSDPGNSLSWRKALQAAVDDLVLAKVRFTVFQAGVSALISGGVGIPLGLYLRRAPRAAAWLRVPFGVPTLVASTAWVALLANTSVLYSVWAVWLAHAVFNIPWVGAQVADAAARVPQSWEELARSLGARRWHRWRAVLWPVIGPAALAAMAQVFVFCSTSFALVLLLGGGPPVETLETAIFSALHSGTLNLPQAIAFGLWQLALATGVAVLSQRFWRPQGGVPAAHSEAAQESRAHLAISCLWILPYFIFLKELRWSIFFQAEFWTSLLPAIHFSLAISIAIAGAATLWAASAVVALRSTGPGRWRRWGELLLLMPSGVGALTLSLSVWLAYSSWWDPFEGSVVAVIVVQTVLFFPVIFRGLWALNRHPPVEVLEVARSLGASAFRAWLTVEWPVLRKPLAGLVGLVAAASLGDLAVVSFFTSAKGATLSLMVSRWLGHYRFEEAQAGAVVLLLLSGVLSWGFRVERG
jgi:thiamine transport system permease protein